MKYLLIFSIWLAAASCQSPARKAAASAPSNGNFPYSLKPSASFTMPPELKEISGITFLQTRPNTIYAIQDENGILFQYDLAAKKITKESTFAGKGDYEEIAATDDYFYVLKSNGVIHSIPANAKVDAKNTFVNKKLVPKGEYESLAFSPSLNSLFLLCKDCEVDKNEKTVSGYILSIGAEGKLVLDRPFSVSIEALSAHDKNIKKTFNPSAMAWRQSSNEWYILSSIDLAIVVTDANFNPKSVIPLDRKNFPQPEGIAFDTQENLYISSEAGKEKRGMIFKFNHSR